MLYVLWYCHCSSLSLSCIILISFYSDLCIVLIWPFCCWQVTVFFTRRFAHFALLLSLNVFPYITQIRIPVNNLLHRNSAQYYPDSDVQCDPFFLFLCLSNRGFWSALSLPEIGPDHCNLLAAVFSGSWNHNCLWCMGTNQVNSPWCVTWHVST